MGEATRQPSLREERWGVWGGGGGAWHGMGPPLGSRGTTHPTFAISRPRSGGPLAARTRPSHQVVQVRKVQQRDNVLVSLAKGGSRSSLRLPPLARYRSLNEVHRDTNTYLDIYGDGYC